MWQCSSMGLTFREIASRLQIGVGTAHRGIYKVYGYWHDVSPAQRSLHPDL